MDDVDTPLYDPTKPIACTIEAGDVPDHVARLERIRADLLTVERTAHGVVLHLADTDANATDVTRFAADERRCCEFWGFAVTRDGEVALRWDGPPSTSAFMDELVDYFEGRRPLGGLLGRL